MINGRPAVFISYSEAAKATVARPFREFVNAMNLYGILVGDEPLPDMGAPDPKGKVDYYLNKASMFVALATPDSKLEDGEIQTRQNILLEISSALERPHLKDRVLVFKAKGVRLPSNINPVYQPLDPEDVSQIFPIFEQQARAWEVLRPLPPDSVPIEPSTPDSEAPPPPEPDSEGVEQAAGSLTELSGFVAGENKGDAGAIAARAHLAASTALASLRSSDPLGVHELNGLYRERDSIIPSAAELQHLFRTMVANIGAANAPGWYWIRNSSASEIRSRVSLVAMGEGDSSTTREALNLLSKAKESPSRGELRTIVKAALHNEEGRHGNSALELLERHGTRADLRALASDLDSYSETERVEAARLGIQSREAPTAALRALLTNPGNLDPAIEANLLLSAQRLPLTKARQALDSPAASMRKLGLRLLDKSSRLKKLDVLRAIDDEPDDSVRLLAARLAVKRRWRISDEQFSRATEKVTLLFNQNEFAVSFMKLRSIEELEQSLSWYGGQSYWIYEALARKTLSAMKDRISTDLDSDFAELHETDRKKYAEEVRAAVEQDFQERFGSDISEKQREQISEMVDSSLKRYLTNWADLENFVLKRFRIAALAVLADNPAPQHARFGRRFLKDDDREVASLAIRILRSCGAADDVPSLTSLAFSSWGELRSQAASTALALANDPRSVAFELLSADDRRVVEVALQSLRASELDREQVEIILPLLRHEDLAIRDAATDHLIHGASRKQLRVLLGFYPKGQYYYSVMARIDRALYAPAWIRQSAAAILSS